MRIDLHCHSKHSKRATVWLMQKLGCPESFTEPTMLYALARRRGMDAVTITDHNSIDGCLEIASLEHTFISCEYTAYFPEDRCKIHVLAHDITPAQHEDLMMARDNIFDLVDYANANHVKCTCAHPLYCVNDRLAASHVEQLLLLFKNFEWNGETNPEMNTAIKALLGQLTPTDMETLANKHGFEHKYPEPWHKNLVAGSDDHSSLNLARTHTEVAGATSLTEFWDGIEHGQARVCAAGSSPESFARNIYSIAYQFYKNRFDLERYRNKDLFLQFLERMLQPCADGQEPFWGRVYQALSRMRKSRRAPAANASLLELVRFEAQRLVQQDPQLANLITQGGQPLQNPDQKWFECVDQVAGNMLVHVGRSVFDRLLNSRLLDLIQSLGSAGTLYAMLAPYFVGFSIYTHQRHACRELLGGFPGQPPRQEPKVAHFTDTLHEINGVARTLKQQLGSALALGKDYTLITVSPTRRPFDRGIRYFDAVGSYDLPEYPELKLLYPPFLQMLSHCYQAGYTHIHVSTPGLVGLAGLGIARILQLPISGTYHTALPQYARVLTEDSHMEDLLWRLMVWFYDQMDLVYSPSQATADDLVRRGIVADKMRVYPRGVDIERFHPTRRDPSVRNRYGIPETSSVMLYVGRVSKEKGLSVLIQAFSSVREQFPSLHLLVIGDGPYRAEMEAALMGTPATFTGYLEGNILPQLYASCDFLVFPSATDTFGNVVLEAHASGIPAIVTDKGGPKENVVHRETGLIVEADLATPLAEAIALLASDESLRKKMGQAGRHYVETRGFQRQFEKLWNMYTDDLPSRLRPADPQPVPQSPPINQTIFYSATSADLKLGKVV